ncbi:T9SS type A sorting domain-containing protein [Calditrichota bacterium]
MILKERSFSNIIFLCSLTLFAGIVQLPAQYQNIKVGNAINAYEPEEPSIVINPMNTDHILIGSNIDNYYYSMDGGLTWQHGVLNSSYGVNADPCVLVDGNGYYYYFHLVPDLSRVVCQKSTSLGGSWSDGSYTGVNLPKDNDKEWAVINRSNGYMYVTWAQFDEHGSTSYQDSSEILLSRSIDGGLNWSPPVPVSDRKGDAMGGNNTDHAPMPAIGPNNEVYVTWMGPDGLMFDKSVDDGQTWLDHDINVSGFHINWLLFNLPGIPITPGFPIINCDLSPGSYNGNIYICWTDQRSGYNDTDVWVVKSTDGGSTWSTPIRVNDDPSGRHQFFAWMTIDQTNGYLYFVFYDRRNYSNSQTDVYMAVSKDGGNTFTNFLVSDSSFIPTANDFIGHYIGVSAHNNIVRPVWTRIDNRQLSLWTAIVDIESSIDADSQKIFPVNFEITSIYPNPFNPATTIRYNLSNKGHVKLSVYNSLGQQIETLVDAVQTRGNHELTWDAKNLSSGVYLFQLQLGELTNTQKAVLLK